MLFLRTWSQSVLSVCGLCHWPLLQEGAAGVFDVLQLQEAWANQERLNILLVDGDMAAVCKIDQSLQSAAGTQWLDWCQTGVKTGVRVVWLVSDWFNWSQTGLGLPGVHALHQDLVLFTFNHVVGEHGVKVRDRSRQNDPVSAELMIPDLHRGQVFSENLSSLQKVQNTP